MGQAVYPAGASLNQGEQVSLSTTVATRGIPSWAHQARIYVPSTDFRMQLNPAIIAVAFYDASESAGSRWKVGSSESGLTMLGALTARSDVFGTAVGTGTIMDSATTSDYLYVVTYDIVGGFFVDVKSANGTANTTIIVEYRKDDDTWAGLTETDGTASGGIALAV